MEELKRTIIILIILILKINILVSFFCMIVKNSPKDAEENVNTILINAFKLFLTLEFTSFTNSSYAF